MLILALVFLSLAVLIHIYIWVLESFLWGKPRGMRVFGTTAQEVETTQEMALNQGFYNLMLAAVTGVGVVLLICGNHQVGPALAYAGAGSMAAGIFLATTSPDKLRSALVQLSTPCVVSR